MIGEVCQTMQTLVSWLALPSQAILPGSKWLSTPISGSKATRALRRAMAVPSLGATLYMKPISRRPLAPGMFCTTIGRIARKVAPEMAREQARIGVIGPARGASRRRG